MHYQECVVSTCTHLPAANTCAGCNERFYMIEPSVILWKGIHWHALCALDEALGELWGTPKTPA